MAGKAKVLKSREIPKYKTRKINRCRKCGRKRFYIRHFGLCRICFREEARQGNIPGVHQSSW